MNQVTVGVPVYNAESLLEQGLENLRAQTYPHFKVVILDNASADRTAEIALSFVKRDSRFSYHRQPYNKGGVPNFGEVLAMADTPYFVWRAYDDLSDANFIAVLAKLLDENAGADLAVCRIVSQKPKGDRVREFFQQRAGEPALAYRMRLLFRSHPSWIYSLFRTAAIKRSFADVRARFPHVIGWDHLALFPFLASGRVVGTNETTFIQRFNPESANAPKHPLRDPYEMRTVRRDFLNFCIGALPKVSQNAGERAVLRVVMPLYAGRAYRLPKILAAHVRTMRGEKPKLSASGVGYAERPAKPRE